MYEDDEYEGEIVWEGHRAEFEVADGMLYLRYLDYRKAPMKLMPGRDVEDQARWMLRELLNEIAIGTAKRRDR